MANRTRTWAQRTSYGNIGTLSIGLGVIGAIGCGGEVGGTMPSQESAAANTATAQPGVVAADGSAQASPGATTTAAAGSAQGTDGATATGVAADGTTTSAMAGEGVAADGTAVQPTGATSTPTTTAATDDASACATLTPDDGLTLRRLRRLSAREIAAVIGDVLGPQFEADVEATLPFEPRLGGFDNQNSALFVSPTFQEATAELAASIASQIDPTALAPCDTPQGSDACLSSFISSFTKRAYGRPATTEELTRLSAVANTGLDYNESVGLVMEAVIQSPHFLYVSELGSPETTPAPGQPVALTPYEVASQLSFLLRGSRPDEALLAAADSGSLATPAGIEAEARRLLAEPQASEQLARFITGWLDMAPIAEAPKNPESFPELTADVVSAMQQEYDSFLSARLNGGTTTLADLMTAQSVDVPPALQAIYGSDYDPVTGLNPERRGGILSLPGVLAYHAADKHSGPVERGLFVRRQLLCQGVPPPPQAVLDQLTANPIDFEDGVQTTRQKYEVHVNEASCAACHLLFDPIGFGLEEMDGIGRYRTMENGLPVNSQGELNGTDVDGSFEGVAELSARLSQSEIFEACMVDHFFRFSTSRSVEPTDGCVVEEWSTAFDQGGAKLSDLVMAYVSHPVFARREDDR